MIPAAPGRVDPPAPAEARLAGVPWHALAGLAPHLDAPLAEVLSGKAAERVLARFLRGRDLASQARTAVAEAVFGVGLWRRRLAWHAGVEEDALAGSALTADPAQGAGPDPAQAEGPRSEARATSRLLLAALIRDLGGQPSGAVERLLDLAPGTLPPPRPPPEDEGRRASLPDWLAATLREEAGAEAAALADALNLPGPIALRPNLLAVTPEALAARLAGEGVSTRPGALVPSALVVTSPRPNIYGLAAHQEGLFEVQDEGSQLLGELVGALPGEAVLDLCAGAGGKALQLAAAVGRSGLVHATDVDSGRLDRLAVRAARAGAAALVRMYSGPLPAGLIVDRALVDAPCSELGALRRGPDLRFRLDPAAFADLPALQLALLERAARHLRPGGRLVYATCTLRHAENQDVALAFEERHPGAERVPLPTAVTGADGFARTWPHRHGCDGFFAAAWTVRG